MARPWDAAAQEPGPLAVEPPIEQKQLLNLSVHRDELVLTDEVDVLGG